VSPRPNSTKLRRQCFEAHKYVHPVTGRTVMDCHICGDVIDPVAGDVWEAEHMNPRALSDDDSAKNLAPAHAGKGSCHAEKTKVDVGRIAKAKRVRDKHFGIKRSASPMPGGKNSPWKKTFANGWVRRDET
jgi:hypothetical protein